MRLGQWSGRIEKLQRTAPHAQISAIPTAANRHYPGRRRQPGRIRTLAPSQAGASSTLHTASPAGPSGLLGYDLNKETLRAANFTPANARAVYASNFSK